MSFSSIAGPPNANDINTPLSRETNALNNDFAEAEQQSEFDDFLKNLQSAKPVPMNNNPPRTNDLLDRSTGSSIIEFDPETKETWEIPTETDNIFNSREITIPDMPGTLPVQIQIDDLETNSESLLNIQKINDLSIDGESNNTVPAASNITATTPTPLVGTTSFPWRTTVKLLMRYGDKFFTCSGATVSSFMVYTAGHCLYSHDPNDDGSTADAQFADEIWVWPAQSDRLFTHREAVEKRDFPYGIAKMAFERTYNAWISSHDYNYDFAWLTLDRRLGDRTGWMGREANVTTASLNYNGYPTETPYVPAGAVFQYPGFDVNNVVSYTPFRIPMDAFVYGGHSGGPVWRLSGSNRYIQGVNSTSNRTGNTEATRVTTDTLNNTTSFIAEDENIRPPVVRPEIIEYELSTTAKDLLTNSVQQGGTIDVKYNAWNIGWQATTVTIDFYRAIGFKNS